MSQSESQSPKEKFTSLLRELFEFDCADLDFGIYRIMNYKRQVIEEWIKKLNNEGLSRIISEELQRGVLDAQEQAQASAAQSRTHEALEAAIYNHLYTFFSRYWQDGDFISKRRY